MRIPDPRVEEMKKAVEQPRPLSLWKKVWLLFLVSGVGLMLILVGSEILLRLLGYTLYYLDKEAFIPSRNSEILYQLRPGFEGLYAGVPIRINSAGFRGKELAAENTLETTRVVILGDSIAFGQGVQEEKTLAAQLEPRLRRKVGNAVEVVNAGVPGYNTCQEWWTFQERVLPLRPRIVVLLYVDNDTDPPVFQVHGDEVISPDVRKGFPGGILAEARKRSALYNLIWMRWQIIKTGSFSIEHYRQILSQKFSDSNPGWIKSCNCLTKLVQLARARSIRLVVIPMPVLWGLIDRPYPFECYTKKVSEAAGRLGAEVVDVLPLLQDRDLRARVSDRDPHPSGEVFRRIADKLAEMLP